MVDPQIEEDGTIARRTRNATRRDSQPDDRDVSPVRKVPQEKAKEWRPRITSDWIAPSKRRLGSHLNEVNPPVSQVPTLDPVNFEFRKIVGLLVTSLKNSPKYSQDFVDELADLTSQYLHVLVTSLHKFTEAQRHLKPGVSDLQMCLSTQSITPNDLYTEYERTLDIPNNFKKHAATIEKQVEVLLRDYYADNYNLEKDDPSLVFHANEQYEIAALVPRQSQRPAYIPAYLPDLPPDYTYQNTGSYMETVKELKQIKLRLVEESRLNEKSLYKLIEDVDRTFSQELEEGLALLGSSETESDEEDIMSDVEERATDIESPLVDTGKELPEPEDKIEDVADETKVEAPIEVPAVEPTSELEPWQDPDFPEEVKEPVPVKNMKKFDFVDYARKRRLAKEREAKQIAVQRRKRERNVFMQAERVYSCFARAPPTPLDTKYFGDILNDGFKKVIRATRTAEAQKREKLTKLLQERAKREQEQEQTNGSFEFGFAFNPTSQFLDDSDDDADMAPAELDFGDESKPQEGVEEDHAIDEETQLQNDLDSVLGPAGDDIDGMLAEFEKTGEWDVGKESEESEEDEMEDV